MNRNRERWRTVGRFLSLVLLVVVGAPRQAVAGKLVGVELGLISEVKSIVPGQTFTVALTLNHTPPYHTYWVNPGTVGIATHILWTLPEGFKAGPIQWQVPERTFMLMYPTHGYKGDTLLLVDIAAPEALHAGPVVLKARASMMTCAQRTCCNVAFKDFELRLITGGKIEWNEVARKRIAEARSRLPRPIPGWEFSATRSDGKLKLVARNLDGLPLKGAEGLYFYSEQSWIDSLVDQEFEVDGAEVVAVLPLSEFAPEKIVKVTGLFYNPSGWPGADGRKYLPVSFVPKRSQAR